MIRYKITDPNYYTQKPTSFLKILKSSKEADLISLRDKSNTKLQKLAKRFKFASIKGKKVLHNDIFLAKRFGFRAIHLSGDQMKLIVPLHRSGFFVMYSAHSLKEIELAVRYRADLITYSPIFSTPNKGAPLGLRQLRKALIKSKKIIALGGITSKKELLKIKRVQCHKFASIRYFL